MAAVSFWIGVFFFSNLLAAAVILEENVSSPTAVVLK